MNDGRQYRIWIDANGEVWIEDPDAGVLPIAEALQPGFGFGSAVQLASAPRLAASRAVWAPEKLSAELDKLWALHDELLAGRPDGPPGDPFPTSLLDVKRAIAAQLFRGCVLCEHRCGVDRQAGERGICKVGPQSFFSAGYVHLAEEREIAPSFCLTMTGCSWHCVYCHTYDIINKPDQGTPLAPPAYADLYTRLASPEIRTLSFVGGNPDHHLPAILDFLAAAPADFALPIVWNSNMYGSPELYRLLDGVVDVYLGDLRYGNDDCAKRLSGLPRCVEPVARNWKLAEAQGAQLIARVLLLPGHLECCVKPMVAWLAKELPTARVSLLDQFHPTYLVAKRAPELDRRPDPAEIEAARRLIDEAGLTVVAPEG